MSENSAIEWTDATWNPVRGCTRVSPGCGGPNHQGGCYAEKIAARFSDPGQPFHGFAKRTKHGGAWTGKVALVEDMLDAPLRWRKPRRVFVNSMSDLFHEDLPDEAIDRVFAVMALAPQHTFQVLTKRPERMRAYLAKPGWSNVTMGDLREIADQLFGRPELVDALDEMRWPLPNVWLGVSVEDQARADERREHMRALADHGWLTWVSYEPALGPVDWRGWDFTRWIVSGGESGPNARPSHPDWHRAARDFCAAHAIAYFFKQWGAWASVYDRDRDDPDWRHCDTVARKTPDGCWLNLAGGHGFHGERVIRVDRIGKKAAGRLLDGRTWDEFPEVRP